MIKQVENIIKLHWKNIIDSNFLYRGMSLDDLNIKSKIILDPNKNPMKEITPILLGYSKLLLDLIAKGLSFNVNDFYIEPLEKILSWTIRDLEKPGIDFTSNYADAVSYAFNYAGSQVKHNFNIITDTIIHKCINQPCFTIKQKEKFQTLTLKIKKILTKTNLKHQPVVIKVKRSCGAFENIKAEELNMGTYQFFYKRISKKIPEIHKLTPEKMAFLLHQISQKENFNVRLIKPLYKKDLQELIKLK